MSLSFEEAKLRYNPDETWWPLRNSKEYKEILELQRQSGTITLMERLGKPVRTVAHTDCIKRGAYVHPLNRHVSDQAKPRVSKHDFLSVACNKSAVDEHVMANAAQPQIMSRSLPAEAPPLPSIPKVGRMSKEDFLKLNGVKEYVDHHIATNSYK